MSSLKQLMESIDDIYEADEVEQPEQVASPAEVVKEIIGSLKELSTMIADGSIEEQDTLLSDLQNISTSLKELVGSDESTDDEWSDESDYDSDDEEELEEEYGAEGMGPSFDKDGTQNYSNPQGSSYPEKKGFVGI